MSIENKYIIQHNSQYTKKEVLPDNNLIEVDYYYDDVTKPKIYYKTKVTVTKEVAEFLESDRRREQSYRRQCRRKIDNSDFEEKLDLYHLPGKDSLLNLVIKREEMRNLRQAFNGLTSDEKELIQRYFFKEMTMEQIGKILGISKMAVSKRLKKVLNKMRSSME